MTRQFHISPIILPIGNSCNLRCRYCFYKNTHSSSIRIMNDELLEKVISQAIEISPERILFYWHGGEPLLAGMQFYDKVVRIEKRYKNCKIANAIQTNGTLLNKEWANFFKNHNFGIGISLDGPKEIHDSQRIFPSGKGSFNLVMKGIDILKQYDIKFGCLCVITKKSLGKAREIFNFFYKNEMHHLDFLPYLERESLKGFTGIDITPEEYADFMIDLFNVFIEKDDPKVKIRIFENLIKLILGANSAHLCSMSGSSDCGTMPSIDLNGDVYFCDNYEGNEGWKLGNIYSTPLKILLNNFMYKKINKEIGEIRSQVGCIKCKIAKLCGSGCSRYWFWRKDHKNICKSRKKIILYVKSKVNDIINKTLAKHL